MNENVTTNKMKQQILSALPQDARLHEFTYSAEHFGNTVVLITKGGKRHAFITDRGEISHNGTIMGFIGIVIYIVSAVAILVNI